MKVLNVKTGVIDRGGVQVRGRFPDEVFELQSKLAADCLTALGIEQAPPAEAAESDALARNPKAVQAWVLFGQGRHALQNRDYDEAVRLLSESVELDGSLAWSNDKSGQDDLIPETLQKAVDLEPDDFDRSSILESGAISLGPLESRRFPGEYLEMLSSLSNHSRRSVAISVTELRPGELTASVHPSPPAFSLSEAHHSHRSVRTSVSTSKSCWVASRS